MKLWLFFCFTLDDISPWATMLICDFFARVSSIKSILGYFWGLGLLWSNMKQKDRKSPKMWLLEVPLLTYCFCSITKHFISIFFVIWHMSYDVIFDALQIYIICFAWKCVIGDIESRSDWTYLLNYSKRARGFFF